jgi:hypothetical protein
VLEDALDRLTMLAQQSAAVGDRAFRLPDSDTSGITTEVSATGNAGKYLRINAGGTALEFADGDLNTTTITQSGTGAVERTLTSKLGEIVSVKDFGATGDGSTDDTSAIQAAIDAVEARGGGEIRLPAGDYKISSTLTINGANVHLVGEGSDDVHGVGSEGTIATTTLTWAGSAGGTMVKFVPTTGASAQKGVGGGVQGTFFEASYSGGSGAGIGLHVQSWDKGEFKDLFFREFATTGLKLDTLAASSLGEEQNCQQNRFISIGGRQQNAGGRFIMLDGNANASANASMNYFENCDVVFSGMAATQGAYDLLDCDNNVFVRCRAFAASADDAVMLHAASDAGFARDNLFINFSSGTNGAIQCKGTEEATNPCNNNTFIALDEGNATPAPTLGTAAWENFWTFTNGQGRIRGVNVLAASAVAVSHTGTTSETVLATVSVPANWMGPNGALEIEFLGTNNNNANDKTWFVRLSSTQFAGQVQTTTISYKHHLVIANRNSASSQIGTTPGPASTGTWGQGNTAVTTAALDTTAALSLTIRGQLEDAGDNMQLEQYIVKLIIP